MNPTDSKDPVRIALSDLKDEQDGIVVEISGGRKAVARLDAIGVRVGVRVRKTAGFKLRGPVMVRVGRAQLAIGHGMASKVIVER